LRFFKSTLGGVTTMFKRLAVLGKIIGLVVLFGTPAFANHIDKATAKVTCTSYSLTVSASSLTIGAKYVINYTIVLTPTSGSPQPSRVRLALQALQAGHSAQL